MRSTAVSCSVLLLVLCLAFKATLAQAIGACGPGGACSCSGTTVNCFSQALTDIPSGIPTNTTTLTLSSNQLTRIPANAFLGLSNLTTLQISQNQITTIATAAFTGLARLRQLTLDGNIITAVPENAFAGLSALTSMRLHDNMITSLSASTFTGLTALTELTLSDNPLTTLPPGLFKGLPNNLRLSVVNGQVLAPNSFVGSTAPPSTYGNASSPRQCDTACATCYNAGAASCCGTNCLSCNSTDLCTQCYDGYEMASGYCIDPSSTSPSSTIADNVSSTAGEASSTPGFNATSTAVFNASSTAVKSTTAAFNASSTAVKSTTATFNASSTAVKSTSSVVNASSTPAFKASSTPAVNASSSDVDASSTAVDASSTPSFNATSTAVFNASSTAVKSTTAAFNASSTAVKSTTAAFNASSTAVKSTSSVVNASSTPAFNASSTPAVNASSSDVDASSTAVDASSTPSFNATSTAVFNASSTAVKSTTAAFNASSTAVKSTTAAFNASSTAVKSTSSVVNASSTPAFKASSTPAVNASSSDVDASSTAVDASSTPSFNATSTAVFNASSTAVKSTTAAFNASSTAVKSTTAAFNASSTAVKSTSSVVNASSTAAFNASSTPAVNASSSDVDASSTAVDASSTPSFNASSTAVFTASSTAVKSSTPVSSSATVKSTTGVSSFTSTAKQTSATSTTSTTATSKASTSTVKPSSTTASSKLSSTSKSFTASSSSVSSFKPVTTPTSSETSSLIPSSFTSPAKQTSATSTTSSTATSKASTSTVKPSSTTASSKLSSTSKSFTASSSSVSSSKPVTSSKTPASSKTSSLISSSRPVTSSKTPASSKTSSLISSSRPVSSNTPTTSKTSSLVVSSSRPVSSATPNPTTSLYLWLALPFGACIGSCGNGIQSRTVVCVAAANASNIVDDSLCSWSPKPVSERFCEPCPTTYEWVMGIFSPCTSPCSTGLQFRSVRCLSSNGLLVVDAYCNATVKPATNQTCTGGNACNWYTSAFSMCAGPCNSTSNQTRSVLCIDETVGSVVSRDQCSVATIPSTTQSCSTPACPVIEQYDWVVGAFGDCSALCGPGTQTRNVSCHSLTNGSYVSDALCEQTSARPTLYQACEVQPCVYSWFYSSWSGVCAYPQCTQTRNLLCANQFGMSVLASYCYNNGETQPASSSPCQTESCTNTPVDCSCTDWSEPSLCSADCGSGTQYRYRVCTEAVYGGNTCAALNLTATSEALACNTQPCPVNCNCTAFRPTSSCTKSCDTGTQTFERTCTGPFNGGLTCAELGFDTAPRTLVCNTQACGDTTLRNCTCGEWSAWSNCTRNCDTGAQSRSRICTEGVNGGATCESLGLERDESRTCNERPCAMPVDALAFMLGFDGTDNQARRSTDSNEASPIIGQAVKFDENSAGIVVDASTAGGLFQFTFSMWLLPASDGSLPADALLVRLPGDSGSALSLRGNEHQVLAPSASMATAFIHDGTSTPSSSNSWKHLALTWDGTTARLYLNGALVDSAPTDSSLEFIPGGEWVVGCIGDGSACYRGLIDEVSLWTSALSDSMLQELVQRGQEHLDVYAQVSAVNPAPPQPPGGDDDTSDSNNLPIIIGAAAGGACLVTVLATILIRRRVRAQHAARGAANQRLDFESSSRAPVPMQSNALVGSQPAQQQAQPVVQPPQQAPQQAKSLQQVQPLRRPASSAGLQPADVYATPVRAVPIPLREQSKAVVVGPNSRPGSTLLPEPAAFRATHKFVPRHGDELSMEVNDVVYILSECSDGWCIVRSRRGKGLVPRNRLVALPLRAAIPSSEAEHVYDPVTPDHLYDPVTPDHLYDPVTPDIDNVYEPVNRENLYDRVADAIDPRPSETSEPLYEPRYSLPATTSPNSEPLYEPRYSTPASSSIQPEHLYDN